MLRVICERTYRPNSYIIAVINRHGPISMHVFPLSNNSNDDNNTFK